MDILNNVGPAAKHRGVKYTPRNVKKEYCHHGVPRLYCPSCEERPNSAGEPAVKTDMICERCGGPVFQVTIPCLSSE